MYYYFNYYYILVDIHILSLSLIKKHIKIVVIRVVYINNRY
jgi:hypothetical protein